MTEANLSYFKRKKNLMEAVVDTDKSSRIYTLSSKSELVGIPYVNYKNLK